MSKFQKIFILVGFVLMGGLIASLPYFIKAQSVDNLVLHFTFDNDMGGMVYDSSSYKNNGTLNGATYIDGKLGKGLLFDGVNDYVKVPSNDSLNPTGSITVQAWVYMQTETKSGKIFQKRGISGKSSSGGYMLGAWFANPDGYAFEMYDVNNAQYIVHTGKDPLSGKWQHIAGTFDGIHLKIYEDGILKQTSPNTAAIMASSPSDLYIGIQENMLMPLAGILDEVKIYNRALNAQEICTAAGKQWNGNQCVSGSDLPDLTPTLLEVKNTSRPSGEKWQAGDNIETTIAIQNIGNTTAGKFSYTIDFGGSLGVESMTPNSLEPQMTYKNTSNVVWTGKVSSKEMKVILWADHTFSDGIAIIEESNENNNTLTITVNTEGGDITPPTVLKAWTDKEVYYPGDSIIAYAAVDDDISGVQLITIRYESSTGRIIESTIYGLGVYQAPNIYKLTLVDAIDLRYQEANTYTLHYESVEKLPILKQLFSQN